MFDIDKYMNKFDILTQSAVLLAFPKYDCSTECYYNKDDNSICMYLIFIKNYYKQ
jgi:hypothetical protein